MTHHTVLRVIAKFLIPLILLFALYVQFHGEYGPGGGFQAGVIFSAAFILYTLVFGVDKAQQVLPPSVLRWTASFGLALYILVGIASLLAGGRYLDYDVLGATPVAGQHIGIIVIEMGVGITVASVMAIIFFAFAGRGQP